MTNREIALVLDELGTILELRGENPFKCRAFHNASRMIATSTADLRQAAREGSLTTIPGIGKGLAPIIADLALHGKSGEAEQLRTSVPPGLLALLKVQGLGPKKVRTLHDRLGIDSPARLREAVQSGRLAGLAGFGEKSGVNILKGLALLEESSGRRLYPEAEEAALELLRHVSAIRGVKIAGLAGSLRRRKETIGDIDIIAGAHPGKAPGIIGEFLTHPAIGSQIGSGPTKASVLLESGIQVDLRVVSVSEYPFALQYFTGSKEHNVGLRALAGTFGWTMNEYGFSPAQKPGVGARSRKGKAIPACTSEDAVYEALGLDPVPPELREATGEIEAARKGSLPGLITIDDLKGAFHCHTTYSDGRNSLKEMVDAAIHLKWKYLGIADHSKVAVYANGLSVKDVRAQLDEIKALNSALKGFRVFSGTEVDILPDGTLDWSDSVLEGFDYVVASVHSRFSMTEQEATKRIIRAIRNPRVTMLGHPTGRLLLEREGYPLNLREVIDAASDHGTMIEINANPHRLDLDWTFCRYAREKGVMLVINPDAHSTGALPDVRFGVNVARRGWLRADDVLNTRTAGQVGRIFGDR
jgi:DNA polymerase (family 10)